MEHNHLIAFSDNGLRAINERVETLRIDLGAAGAILFDQSGQLLTECGEHGDLDVTTFLSLLGNAMSASNEVIHLLRDEAAFDLHFHEGRNYDLHTARISDRIFMTLIFERHTGSSRVGMVWIALRRAVTELRELLQNATIASGTPESDEIKTAVSDAVDETLSLFDEAILPGKSLFEKTKPPSREPLPISEPAPAPRSRTSQPTSAPTPSAPSEERANRPKRARLLKVGDIFSARPETELAKPEAAPAPRVSKNKKEFSWATFEPEQPGEEPEPAKPAPPPVSSDVLSDPHHVLTYEEARALGLINLDAPAGDSPQR